MELLISISLMMAAIGIAIPFFVAQSRSLEASSGRLDAQLNINFGLDAIDRDLRVAGVGITQRQPLLVQAASNAITFNADLTSTTRRGLLRRLLRPGCSRRLGHDALAGQQGHAA